MKQIENYGKTLLAKRQLLLQGPVDGDKQEEISASILYLNALDDKTPISLFIDSYGGTSCAGGYMCDVIRTSSAPVHGIVIGPCCSAAFKVLQACQRRIAHKNSMFLFHSTRIKEFRILMNRKKAIAWFDKLRSQDQLEIKDLARRSGQTCKQLRQWAEDEKEFTSRQALQMGFIDEIR